MEPFKATKFAHLECYIETIMNIIRKITLSVAAATAVICAAPHNPLSAQQPQQTDPQQRPAAEDPIRELNLSPEQREQIRAIRQQLQAERAETNRRLRETNQALEEALDADNPDEGVIDQRVRDFATAQAAAVRMRVLSEVRIRRVLTPDQLVTLRTLRQKARLARGERLRENKEIRRQERVERRRDLRRTGLGPLAPRRPVPLEKTRP
jgi:Spy/CpxP family protein refolding chaperone